MYKENQKYYIDKRKYAIRFVFLSKHEALNFRLPSEYKKNFELNNGLGIEDEKFIRVAQIKLK